MDELIERLHERAEFEDKRVLDEAKAMGFEPEVYTGSQTGALLREAAAALEAAREDVERYRWLRDRMTAEEITDETYARLALRVMGPIVKRPADSDYYDELDAAIDRARGKGGGG